MTRFIKTYQGSDIEKTMIANMLDATHIEGCYGSREVRINEINKA